MQTKTKSAKKPKSAKKTKKVTKVTPRKNKSMTAEELELLADYVYEDNKSTRLAAGVNTNSTESILRAYLRAVEREKKKARK